MSIAFRSSLLLPWLAAMIMGALFTQTTFGQCSSCTTTIGADQTNLTVGTGTTCILPGVTVDGSITIMTGGILCNQGTLDISGMTVATAAHGQLVNYGTIQCSGSMTWGTNVTGSIDNHGVIVTKDLHLGYHNGYAVNLTHRSGASLTVNCVAYLLCGSFQFDGPATFNCPIYLSGGGTSSTTTLINNTVHCSNTVNVNAGSGSTFTVAAPGQFTCSDMVVTDDANIIVNGTMKLSGEMILQAVGSPETIQIQQSGILAVQGSSASNGITVQTVSGGSVTITNNGATSVDHDVIMQGGSLVMNGGNLFAEDLILTSGAAISSSLPCGGRITVAGTSSLGAGCTMVSGVDLLDLTGLDWDAGEAGCSGTHGTCTGIGTESTYATFPPSDACCAPSSGSDSVSSCDSYTSPSGDVWTSSGIYLDTLTSVAGCDSVVTYTVSIASSTANTISPNSCGPYGSPSGAHIWTTSGTYADTLANAAGCDSMITVNLTVTNVDTSVSTTGSTLTAVAPPPATYQWIDCSTGTAVVGAVGQSFSPLASGTYAVLVTQSGCTDTSRCVEVILASNDNLPSLSGTVIYPNPTDGLLCILAPVASGKVVVRIITLQGQQCIEMEYPSGQERCLTLEGLPAGVYFLQVRQSDITSHHKLILH